MKAIACKCGLVQAIIVRLAYDAKNSFNFHLNCTIFSMPHKHLFRYMGSITYIIGTQIRRKMLRAVCQIASSVRRRQVVNRQMKRAKPKTERARIESKQKQNRTVVDETEATAVAALVPIHSDSTPNTRK